jgi:hypothetical protein
VAADDNLGGVELSAAMHIYKRVNLCDMHVEVNAPPYGHIYSEMVLFTHVKVKMK